MRYWATVLFTATFGLVASWAIQLWTLPRVGLETMSFGEWTVLAAMLAVFYVLFQLLADAAQTKNRGRFQK